MAKIPQCKECKREGSYNERYDAYFCLDCILWIEKNCGSSDCFFCKDRPEKPPNLLNLQKSIYICEFCGVNPRYDQCDCDKLSPYCDKCGSCGEEMCCKGCDYCNEGNNADI